MADDQRRNIDANDYHRAHLTLIALKLKAVRGSDEPLADLLRFVHEEYARPGLPVVPSDLVGDEAANREVQHAILMLECLDQGKTTMPDLEIDAIETECATPGCHELTHGSLCFLCELKQVDGGTDEG